MFLLSCQHDDFSSPRRSLPFNVSMSSQFKTVSIVHSSYARELEGLLTGISTFVFVDTTEINKRIFSVSNCNINEIWWRPRRTRNDIESRLYTRAMYICCNPSSCLCVCENGRSRAWKRVKKAFESKNTLILCWNISSLLRRRTAVKRIAQ